MITVGMVLPIWNGAFVLNQTIDSILNQYDNDFKCIIINDGSTDDTAKILAEIDDSRFTITALSERKGAGYARNIGNDLALFDIVCVVDCGDILYPDKVLAVRKYFADNPRIDIMCSATDSIDGSPAVKPRLFKGSAGEKLGFEHPGVAYRRAVIRKIKYRTTSLDTDQYDAFFFEAKRIGYNFGIHEQPLSSKCTFDKYTGGRDLDAALLVKADIYREFNISLPEWLVEHERRMKLCKTK